MSYKNKEKAKTKKDKMLAIKHLNATIKLAHQKKIDHLKAASSEGYTGPYNRAHAKDHDKEEKDAKKLRKVYTKSIKKKNKKLKKESKK